MLEVKMLPLALDIGQYQYAVIAARYQGKWVWVKHRDRDTWEMPGGHIEKGETADEAAKRELAEETGAIKFRIQPICDYFVSTGKKSGTSRLYLAIIDEIGPLPESEIARIELFENLPEKLTHSEIQPILYKEVLKLV